jgi:RNA polymerase sigma-70 factor, ECF subfamily
MASPSQPAAAALLPTTAQVFAEHGPYVFRTLRYLGVPERDLPDVVQETFVVVHRKLPEFEARSSVRTWLYRICRRTASDYRRKAHVRRESLREPDDEMGQELTQPANAIEARQLLLRALDTLDDEKREVFVLAEVEGLTMTEVVEVLGCPLQTGYSRLSAARKRVEEFVRSTHQGAA